MSGEHNSGGRIAPLALAALGVVYGDIGTSPLYAMSACFTGPNIQVTPEHIFGILSLIFWVLVLIILLKYVAVVLNADNKGEGGVLALTALVVNTERAESAKAHVRDARHSGRRAVLLGRCDHAGDLGIERRGRSARCRAGCADSHPADHRCRAGRAVPDSAAWHRIGRQGVRTGDARVVRDPRGHGRELDRARAPRAGRALSRVRAAIDRAASDQCARGARRRVPHRDRRRGALCGHGTFRQNADPSELECDRHARAGLELLRSGRDAHRESGRHLESVLPHGAAVVASAARGHRDRGDRHCLASGDLRSVLRHHAGREPGTLPARARRALLRRIRRADLRAHHELDHDAGDSRTGAGFRQLGRARGRLRLGGVGRHDHRDAAHA